MIGYLYALMPQQSSLEFFDIGGANNEGQYISTSLAISVLLSVAAHSGLRLRPFPGL